MAIGDLLISGDGKLGQDGQDGQGYLGNSPQMGGRGRDGKNATSPTEGSDGQFVHVSLARASEQGPTSTHLVVAVNKHPDHCTEISGHPPLMEKFRHHLGQQGRISITACGGAGGKGGSGGNGESGGNGIPGTNATAERNGTDGGAGGDGGNAGAGTSGAKGGKGGGIKLIVKESDLDLLIAFDCLSAKGGKGGQAGTHGNAGLGGSGGPGGSAYETRVKMRTEHGAKEVIQLNAGGVSGKPGATGDPVATNLENGADGQDGAVAIYIENADAQLTGPFATPFHLEISDFEVVDSNEDGIIEFGEEVTIRNIRVQNSGMSNLNRSDLGGTPSPSASLATVEGESTDWLVAPRAVHKIPKSISNGASVLIDGKFTFRVKRPKDSPPSEPLVVQHAFSLKGHMSGINRALVNFNTPRGVTLQHPIAMEKPKYLNCLTLGQETVITWKNKSTRELGARSPSGRRISCLVSQSGESALMFGPSGAESLEMSIDSLPAGGEKEIELLVKVPRKAIQYRKTNIRISLLFAPPDDSHPTAIQVYNLPIQVSNSYRHDRDASVLLVTNYETTNEEVGLWNHLVTGHLGLKMDIWNVSVNGHLELLGGPRNTERQSLFDLYKGKTIVILGNSFSYFDRGERTAMDLMDSRDLIPSTLGGTSILISGMAPDKSQPHPLARLLCSSTHPEVRMYPNVTQLVTGVGMERHDRKFTQTQFICTPTLKGDNSQRCLSKANKAASELLRRFPHLRFMINWTPDTSGGSTAGRVEVRPCVPYDCSKFIITRPAPDNIIGDMNELAILLALPFETKLKVLWELFSDEGPFRKKVSIQGLSEVVEAEMVAELARLVNASPPWPDAIQKDELCSCLPRINQFVHYEPSRIFGASSVSRVVEMVGNLRLLADCCPGSAPRKLTFATRRKNVWAEVADKLDLFIKGHFPPPDKKAKDHPYLNYMTYVLDETAKTSMKPPATRKQDITHRAIAKLPRVNVGGDFSEATTGIIDFEICGNIVAGPAESVAMKECNAAHATRLEEDLNYAKAQVQNDMSHLPSYTA